MPMDKILQCGPAPVRLLSSNSLMTRDAADRATLLYRAVTERSWLGRGRWVARTGNKLLGLVHVKLVR